MTERTAIDLKAPGGQALVHRLVENTDVVVHNFQPGVTEGLGLGSEKLRTLNPRLVCVTLSGFGEDRPLRC